MNNINRFHSWRRKLRWNRQYKSGRWENLKDEKEAVRYQKIIDFIKIYGNDHPNIMDLGCGEGILCERMNEKNYASFLGIDFSSISIQNATNLNLKNTEFICVNIHDFQPNKKYDVVVFNEVFYYLHESQKQIVLDKIVDCLNENGIIIISIYREKLGCWNYFETFKQLDFSIVTNNDDHMYWKIGVYKK